MKDTTICRECGKETSILNGAYCSTICESKWVSDERYNHPYSNRPDIIKKHSQKTPTWKEVQTAQFRPRVLNSNLSKHEKQQLKDKEIARLRMHEEQKAIRENKKMNWLFYKKLDRINKAIL